MGSLRKYTEDLVSALFSYTNKERRGVVLISAVVVAVLSYVYIFSDKPLDRGSLGVIDAASDSLRSSRTVLSARRDFPDSLFVFDPNAASVDEFLKLGFSRRQAVAIDNYRKAGTVFRKPGDFKRSFVVSDEMFARLEPFIEIGAIPQESTGERPVRAAARKPVYVELNSADSAALTTVVGIGEVLSARIIKYRERLGGFVDVAQLKEVYGINEDNFDGISKQFFVDSAVIQKIDINFAPANKLAEHPYITRSMAARVDAGRKIKGGWGNLKELVDSDILLPDEAQRISAYVEFR